MSNRSYIGYARRYGKCWAEVKRTAKGRLQYAMYCFVSRRENLILDLME